MAKLTSQGFPDKGEECTLRCRSRSYTQPAVAQDLEAWHAWTQYLSRGPRKPRERALGHTNRDASRCQCGRLTQRMRIAFARNFLGPHAGALAIGALPLNIGMRNRRVVVTRT